MDQAFQVVRTQADHCVMRPGGGEAGEDVFIALGCAMRINVGIAGRDVKPRDHFRHVGRDDKGVRFPGRFIHVRTFFRDPIVLEIVPAAFAIGVALGAPGPAPPITPTTEFTCTVVPA